jgi:hypothetical protein
VLLLMLLLLLLLLPLTASAMANFGANFPGAIPLGAVGYPRAPPAQHPKNLGARAASCALSPPRTRLTRWCACSQRLSSPTTSVARLARSILRCPVVSCSKLNRSQTSINWS